MTVQTRFKDQLYTPGERKPPKRTIVRFDQEIQDQWNAIHAKRGELRARLNAVNGELEQTKVNAIAMIVEGCDYAEYIDKLGYLRIEAEVLEDAINYLDSQGDALRRGNPWLTSR